MVNKVVCALVAMVFLGTITSYAADQSVSTCKQLLKTASNNSKMVENMSSDSYESRKATTWLKTHQIQVQECQKVKAKTGMTPADVAEQTHPSDYCDVCRNALIN